MSEKFPSFSGPPMIPHGSPKRKRRRRDRSRRSQHQALPPIRNPKPLHLLEGPESLIASELPEGFPTELAYRALAAYSLLRTLSIQLRLSPFTPNVFLRALMLPYPDRLLGQVHVALLRVLLPHLHMGYSYRDRGGGVCVAKRRRVDGVWWDLRGGDNLTYLDGLTWPLFYDDYVHLTADHLWALMNDTKLHFDSHSEVFDSMIQGVEYAAERQEERPAKGVKGTAAPPVVSFPGFALRRKGMVLPSRTGHPVTGIQHTNTSPLRPRRSRMMEHLSPQSEETESEDDAALDSASEFEEDDDDDDDDEEYGAKPRKRPRGSPRGRPTTLSKMMRPTIAPASTKISNGTPTAASSNTVRSTATTKGTIPVATSHVGEASKKNHLLGSQVNAVRPGASVPMSISTSPITAKVHNNAPPVNAPAANVPPMNAKLMNSPPVNAPPVNAPTVSGEDATVMPAGRSDAKRDNPQPIAQHTQPSGSHSDEPPAKRMKGTGGDAVAGPYAYPPPYGYPPQWQGQPYYPYPYPYAYPLPHGAVMPPPPSQTEAPKSDDKKESLGAQSKPSSVPTNPLESSAKMPPPSQNETKSDQGKESFGAQSNPYSVTIYPRETSAAQLGQPPKSAPATMGYPYPYSHPYAYPLPHGTVMPPPLGQTEAANSDDKKESLGAQSKPGSIPTNPLKSSAAMPPPSQAETTHAGQGKETSGTQSKPGPVPTKRQEYDAAMPPPSQAENANTGQAKESLGTQPKPVSVPANPRESSADQLHQLSKATPASGRGPPQQEEMTATVWNRPMFPGYAPYASRPHSVPGPHPSTNAGKPTEAGAVSMVPIAKATVKLPELTKLEEPAEQNMNSYAVASDCADLIQKFVASGGSERKEAPQQHSAENNEDAAELQERPEQSDKVPVDSKPGTSQFAPPDEWPQFTPIKAMRDGIPYHRLPLEEKLRMLEFLIDELMAVDDISLEFTKRQHALGACSFPYGALPSKEELESLVNQDDCGICGKEGDLLCCDGCVRSFHRQCIGMATGAPLPVGKWLCPDCKNVDCTRYGTLRGGQKPLLDWFTLSDIEAPNISSHSSGGDSLNHQVVKSRDMLDTAGSLASQEFLVVHGFVFMRPGHENLGSRNYIPPRYVPVSQNELYRLLQKIGPSTCCKWPFSQIPMDPPKLWANVNEPERTTKMTKYFALRESFDPSFYLSRYRLAPIPSSMHAKGSKKTPLLLSNYESECCAPFMQALTEALSRDMSRDAGIASALSSSTVLFNPYEMISTYLISLERSLSRGCLLDVNWAIRNGVHNPRQWHQEVKECRSIKKLAMKLVNLIDSCHSRVFLEGWTDLAAPAIGSKKGMRESGSSAESGDVPLYNTLPDDWTPEGEMARRRWQRARDSNMLTLLYRESYSLDGSAHTDESIAAKLSRKKRKNKTTVKTERFVQESVDSQSEDRTAVAKNSAAPDTGPPIVDTHLSEAATCSPSSEARSESHSHGNSNQQEVVTFSAPRSKTNGATAEDDESPSGKASSELGKTLEKSPTSMAESGLEVDSASPSKPVKACHGESSSAERVDPDKAVSHAALVTQAEDEPEREQNESLVKANMEKEQTTSSKIETNGGQPKVSSPETMSSDKTQDAHPETSSSGTNVASESLRDSLAPGIATNDSLCISAKQSAESAISTVQVNNSSPERVDADRTTSRAAPVKQTEGGSERKQNNSLLQVTMEKELAAGRKFEEFNGEPPKTSSDTSGIKAPATMSSDKTQDAPHLETMSSHGSLTKNHLAHETVANDSSRISVNQSSESAVPTANVSKNSTEKCLVREENTDDMSLHSVANKAVAARETEEQEFGHSSGVVFVSKDMQQVDKPTTSLKPEGSTSKAGAKRRKRSKKKATTARKTTRRSGRRLHHPPWEANADGSQCDQTVAIDNEREERLKQLEQLSSLPWEKEIDWPLAGRKLFDPVGYLPRSEMKRLGRNAGIVAASFVRYTAYEVGEASVYHAWRKRVLRTNSFEDLIVQIRVLSSFLDKQALQSCESLARRTPKAKSHVHTRVACRQRDLKTGSMHYFVVNESRGRRKGAWVTSGSIELSPLIMDRSACIDEKLAMCVREKRPPAKPVPETRPESDQQLAALQRQEAAALSVRVAAAYSWPAQYLMQVSRNAAQPYGEDYSIGLASAARLALAAARTPEIDKVVEQHETETSRLILRCRELGLSSIPQSEIGCLRLESVERMYRQGSFGAQPLSESSILSLLADAEKAAIDKMENLQSLEQFRSTTSPLDFGGHANALSGQFPQGTRPTASTLPSVPSERVPSASMNIEFPNEHWSVDERPSDQNAMAGGAYLGTEDMNGSQSRVSNGDPGKLHPLVSRSRKIVSYSETPTMNQMRGGNVGTSNVTLPNGGMGGYAQAAAYHTGVPPTQLQAAQSQQMLQYQSQQFMPPPPVQQSFQPPQQSYRQQQSSPWFQPPYSSGEHSSESDPFLPATTAPAAAARTGSMDSTQRLLEQTTNIACPRSYNGTRTT